MGKVIFLLKKIVYPHNLVGLLRFIFKVKNKIALLQIILKNTSKNLKLEHEGQIITFTEVSINQIGALLEIFGKEIYKIDIEAKTILDLGAYIGDYTIYAALKYPRADIYAFEPYSKNFELVKKNLELNKLNTSKIRIFRNAISDKISKMKLYIYDNSELSSLKNDESNVGYETVRTITLEKFIRDKSINKIDLLKIDIEGLEYDVLYNLSDETFRKISWIITELHPIPGNSISALLSYLNKKDFELNSYDKTGLIYKLKRSKQS